MCSIIWVYKHVHEHDGSIRSGKKERMLCIWEAKILVAVLCIFFYLEYISSGNLHPDLGVKRLNKTGNSHKVKCVPKDIITKSRFNFFYLPSIPGLTLNIFLMMGKQEVCLCKSE